MKNIDLKKIILLTTFPFFIFGNTGKVTEIKYNQNCEREIKDLNQKLSNIYKPGLGEFMANIQRHHSKLWFAGINKNWDLANYELDELKENIEDVEKYATERVESKQIIMLEPAINEIKNSINKKNVSKFQDSFKILTTSCNSCHTSNNFKFNVITIPKSPPVTNQDFRPSH